MALFALDLSPGKGEAMLIKTRIVPGPRFVVGRGFWPEGGRSPARLRVKPR